MTRRFYPIFLDIKGRFAVVVGGGAVAERKTAELLECRADVRVVAPEVTARLARLAEQRRIEWLRRKFHPQDVEKAFMVFAITDDRAVNTRVCQVCDYNGIMVNRAESPEASDFIVPATLRRGSLTIAVSTGGASPALARGVRDRLAGEFGPDFDDYVGLLEAARAKVMRTVSDARLRRAVLRALAEDPELPEILKREGEQGAMKHADSIVEKAMKNP